jgi:serine/threonine protein kinase
MQRCSLTLVVGGSGVLGRLVVRSLLGRGEHVRVMTRQPAALADMKAEGVDVVSGDLLDVATVRRACHGASRVVASAYSLVGAGKNRSENVDRAGHLALVEAARDSGVRRLVYARATECDLPDTIARFRTEACLARRVRHPNVCRTHSFGSHADAVCEQHRVYFATMDLLPGCTLRNQLIQRGPLSASEVMMLARDVLQGLAAIHDAQIIHRDIKSDNVMVATGARGATLIDFGLALPAANAASSERPRRGHGRSGSAGYMAPEQLLSRPLGYPTDLFALGVVLFEALTGKLPYVSQRPATQPTTQSERLAWPTPWMPAAMCSAHAGL